MKKRISKHIIPLLFVAVFLAPRVANLHALEHVSEDESPVSCELCDELIQAQQFDLGLVDASYLEEEAKALPCPFVVISYYNVPRETIVSPAFIYNKPPPPVV